MKTTEIIQLNSLISFLKPKELTLEEIKNLLDLKKELKQIASSTDELKVEMAKNYELPFVDGGYQFLGHPKQSEIELMIKSIEGSTHELKSALNFLSYEKLLKMLDGNINVDSIILLHQFLVKQ